MIGIDPASDGLAPRPQVGTGNVCSNTYESSKMQGNFHVLL